VREAFFCASFGESDPEIAALSVPVLGVGRRLVGALTISGPRYRLEELGVQPALPVLFACAKKLAAVFGGSPDWYPQHRLGETPGRSVLK
jgi:DNA-binding IclR family transcriptional regulator